MRQMENVWLKHTLYLAAEIEEEFVAEVLASSYTLGWLEPHIEVVRTDNGYDYEEKRDAPVIAYLFEPMSESEEIHLRKLRAFLSRWGNRVALQASERVQEESESWKEEFQEVEVGDWLIAPTWTPRERLAGRNRILWIDPGPAFGTGYHGTTQDILRFLQTIKLAGKKVIDIGTGSGILSVFCAVQGAARPVCAIDINPESRHQVALHLANNQLPESAVEVIIGDPLQPDIREKLPKQADLMIINIGGDEDVAMLPVVQHALAPGGTLILSGLVEWNRDRVEAAYAEAGFTVLSERQSGEWITLLTKLCDNKKR
jgi:ribosomal protein L11 methyltransferase